MKINFALVIFAAFLSTSVARKRLRCFELPDDTETTKSPCGINEKYEKCTTLCGEATCDRRRAFYCGAGCEEKCLCKDGYIRDANNQCIKIEDCPVVQPVCAKAHEAYNECGTACPTTCENKDDTERFCTRQCVQGCFCENGYVRDASGECILPNQCPVVQPTNQTTTEEPASTLPVCAKAHETYYDCGTACPLTCKNKDNPPLFCTFNCVVGCACESGYVKDDNDDCILPEQCPESIIETTTAETTTTTTLSACSKPYESYVCGTSCPITCKNKDSPRSTCSFSCQCACDSQFVRNDNGDCVLGEECPETTTTEAATTTSTTIPTCSQPNTVYSACACDATCDNPTPSCEGCTSGCMCRGGYIRDGAGSCIRPSQCPVP